jgi:hypothetical protein
MKTTKHARVKARQRGIKDIAVDIVAAFGFLLDRKTPPAYITSAK